MMTLKIGLTGGLCSGKSTVSQFFADLGVPIIDADVFVRGLITQNKQVLAQLIDHFGTKILKADGTPDRSLLRQLVFENPAERIWLEKLLHPQVIEQIQKAVKILHSPYCIIVIPLLAEMLNPHMLVDRILVVDVPEEVQITRTQCRDQIALPLIHKMLQSQASRAQRLKIADDIIENTRDLTSLKQQVRTLHEFYLDLTC